MDINATIIGQAISFFIFVTFCMKYVWPPLRTAMVDREKKIAQGLQNAEQAEKSLSDANVKVQETLKQAKIQAAELIEQANKRANQLIDEAKEQAKEEGLRIKDQAQTEIQQELNRAKESLKEQVSDLAIRGAEKILRADVDKSKHKDMLNQLATEL